MTNIIYEKPPLVEAIAAIHLDVNETWDWTVPGLLYNEVHARFPKKSQEQTVQFELSSTSTNPTIQGVPVKMRFSNQAENCLVQIAPNMLTYNALDSGYPGWETFLNEFLELIEHYVHVYPEAKINRMGLRYINDIEIPLEPDCAMELQEWFELGLVLPRTSRHYDQLSFLMRTTVEFEAYEALRMNLTFATEQKTDEQSRRVFRLDLDTFESFAPTHVVSRDTSSLRDWFEGAHEVVEETFTKSLTSKTRQELFGRKS